MFTFGSTPRLQVALIVLGAMIAGACAGRRTPATAPTPTRVEPATTQISTPALSQQYEITEQDNGRTFTYSLTSRFTVILDGTSYPPQELACSPAGMIGGVSNIPPVAPPLYAARFEAVAPGECILKDRGFSVTIKVVE